MSGIAIFPTIRVRKTPFWDRVVESGVKACSVYNRMLLPVRFVSEESDYFHLKEHVQVWDVSCERQVEVNGPDATELIELLTPRPINTLKPGWCIYLPVVDQHGGMLNDPVLVKLSETQYWISLSDSDYLLWVKAVAAVKKLRVNVFEPDISPLGVQGPKADDLMAKVFGDEIRTLRFFQFQTVEFNNRRHIVARSGYSKQGGFEIYLAGSENGLSLWDALMESGAEFNVRAGGPNLAERIEAGLLSYGSDMTSQNTPFECGLARYCSVNETPKCIGHDALKKVWQEGWKREIRAMEIRGPKVPDCHTPWPLKAVGRYAGQVTSAAWSPGFKTNVAIAMVEKEFLTEGTKVAVEAPDGVRTAVVKEHFFA